MTQTLFLQNARLIDGLSAEPQEGVSILIEDERIREVVPASAGRPAPAEATVVDLRGKTVVPGLIDTHVHMTMMDESYYPLFLAAGVTSARDLGGKLENVLALRTDLESGKLLGPRLLVYGPMLDGAVPSAEAPFFLDVSDRVPSPEAVPEKVGRLLEAGVDGVKLYYTMPPETTRAAIDFVDKRVPITGHLGYTDSIDAIHAGIDGLEHAWISPYNDFCALDMRYGPPTLMSAEWYQHTARGWAGADLESSRARNWFDAMVEKQVALGTTHVMLWITKFGREAARRDPDRRYRPPSVMDGLVESVEGAPDFLAEAEMFFDASSPLPEALQQMHELTRTLCDAGGVVVGGTDTGAMTYPPPGFALLREVELLADSIGAMRAIQAVTSAAARHLRREQDIGSVAPGRYADLLVIDGDPLRDVRELRNLVRVYRGGSPYEPEDLLAKVPQRSL